MNLLTAAVVFMAMRGLRSGERSYLRPVSGRVTSAFGERVHPVTAVVSHHNGWDLAAAVGTPVLAPGYGRVERVWSDDVNGNALRLVCGPYTFGFAHLERALVVEGEQVPRGTAVARSGNTGRSTGPHLHVTVWLDGRAVDPAHLWGATGNDGVA